MNKQELTNQILQQLTADKDIQAFVKYLRQAAQQQSSSMVEEPSAVYRRANESEEFIMPVSASDWQQACLDILRKTVQTTLDAVQAEGANTPTREQVIARSFNRFDAVYKALS